jgi:hypothetical protein
VGILDDLNDGFSGQPMPGGVLPRSAFAVFGGRTSGRVAPIGFDLSERGHGVVGRSVEATFTETPLRSSQESLPIKAASNGRGRISAKTIRLRDKDHRKFVSSQPCLVCGRSPADAHHLRR